MPSAPHEPGTGTDRTAVLLIAHGSRNPDATRDHTDLCRRTAATTGLDVVPAYLELTTPSIPDAIDAAIGSGARTVRLVPLFLHTGNHVQRDLPEIAATSRQRHPDVQIVLEEHIGADPALAALVARRITGP